VHTKIGSMGLQNKPWKVVETILLTTGYSIAEPRWLCVYVSRNVLHPWMDACEFNPACRRQAKSSAYIFAIFWYCFVYIVWMLVKLLRLSIFKRLKRYINFIFIKFQLHSPVNFLGYTVKYMGLVSLVNITISFRCELRNYLLYFTGFFLYICYLHAPLKKKQG